MPHDGSVPQLPDCLIGNAHLLVEGAIRRGSLAVAQGRIVAIETGGAALPPGAEDCEGDLLIPGLVELHTDNLERHLQPRPGVDWPPAPAILAHDAELAGLGITTVFDALRIGTLVSHPPPGHVRYARALASEIGRLRAAGALRIRHHLHLRAEVCSETLTEELGEFSDRDRVGIVSLMDHTPGQRQFTDLAQMRRFHQQRHGGGGDFEGHVAMLMAVRERFGSAHQAAAVVAARRLGAVLASHDDTSLADVAASAEAGARLAEFPTTRAAAEACRAAGIAVMMGAPNLLRGGSHSGNVAAAELAGAGLLDILSSDYVPAALMIGAVRLGLEAGNLAAGLATVTEAPARAAGLDDRGRLAPGLRADLVRLRLLGEMPLVRGVWVGGARVA